MARLTSDNIPAIGSLIYVQRDCPPVIFLRYSESRRVRSDRHYLCYDFMHAYPEPYLDWWGNISRDEFGTTAPLSYMLLALWELTKGIPK